VRIEMLAEALEVIRMLWDGEQHSHRGTYYTVENARLYDAFGEPSDDDVS
jgi:alkanesulfonate monooxygenase SsuD/methylene tetrahydromethanopterin reductase-like flavin-dependent oxidoreductase (luciferase family)